MTSSVSKFFEFMRLIGQLKQVKRTGWVRKNVKDPESVSDHMYRMAMIAFAIPSNSGLDRDKCIKIALVHDMSESIVGDLTPWCGVSKEDKSCREKTATSHISSLISEEAGKEMYQLWMEYENQSSPEAIFVKDLDKFEMLFQAYEYENLHNRPKSLQEFFDHTNAKHTFSTKLVDGWCKQLEMERELKQSKSDATQSSAELKQSKSDATQSSAELKQSKSDATKSAVSLGKEKLDRSSPLIKKRKVDPVPEEKV
ncbi:5'-deoxynucleotidase HDDC2-like [Physella acuta]|uniref:5'-deoxynucleotidase HDDC2-like n=1 Tax=Physella acuta TaxID=109671 RepID=UPI0027DD180F|nr:5'-deoxynucleotidase HDDC2-like [Physella acuta]